jgi:molybdate transport system ATP-binding protein/molybdate/tungstate transport system ATP-binding protein
VLRIENISKNLGEFCLKDVTLEINDGEYFMVVGPTGAGKTILLETIAGIYHPDKGKIFLDGRDISNIPLKDRRISVVYQDYMLFPHLTVAQNIGFGLRSKKVPQGEIKRKINESANLLGVSYLFHRYSGTLSGGEQQRVAIARAIVTEPKVLLLDEPLSALDMQTARRLRQELHKIHSITKTTTIHVTHNFEEAFILGDRIGVMNEGEIVQVDEPNEVFTKPSSEFVANFLGVENLFRGKSTRLGDITDIEVNQIHILSTTQKLGDVSISVRPEDILVSKKPLESSALNTFNGKVEDAIDKGAVVELVVDIGIPLVAMITKISFEEMGLEKGISVYLTFKAGAVHIF